MKALILAALVLATPALAGSDIPVPPKKYDKPYTGRLVIVEVPVADMFVACDDGKKYKNPAVACAESYGKSCIVFFPPRASLSSEDWACLWRHEIGHCNGWSNKHPGARDCK